MHQKNANKAQSAVEFLSTYAFAFLLLVLIIGALVYFVQLPQQVIPSRCSFAYGITCAGVEVGSNSVDTVVNLYLVNNQEYNLVGNTIATVAFAQAGTANALCNPANVLEGGVTICRVLIPAATPVGQQIVGTVYLNSSACISGSESTCQYEQPLSYLGNFTTSVAASTSKIPVTMYVTASNTLVAPNYEENITLTAHVTVFGLPARSATVTFALVSSTSAGTYNTLGQGFVYLSQYTYLPITPAYAISDATGSASTNLFVASLSAPGTITYSASFGGASATNTVTVT